MLSLGACGGIASPLPHILSSWVKATFQSPLVLLFWLSCVQLFCDPRDCSPPGFFVHGIFQARILEWVAISYSRGSSQPRGQTLLSHLGKFSCANSAYITTEQTRKVYCITFQTPWFSIHNTVYLSLHIQCLYFPVGTKGSHLPGPLLGNSQSLQLCDHWTVCFVEGPEICHAGGAGGSTNQTFCVWLVPHTQPA